MDGLFASDKAKLRPPPSFIKPGGGSSTAAVPASAKDLMGRDSSSSRDRERPGTSMLSNHTAHNPNDTLGLSSLRFGRDAPSSKPTSAPAGYTSPMSGYTHASECREPSTRDRDPSPSWHHSERTTSVRNEQSLDMERGVPSGRRKVVARPAAATKGVRTKSPNPQTMRKTTTKGAPGVANKPKRRPTELEQAKETTEKLKYTIDQQRKDIVMLEDRLDMEHQRFQDELDRQREEAQYSFDQLVADMDNMKRQKDEQIRDLEIEKQQAIAEAKRMSDEVENQKKLAIRRIESITEEANARIEEYTEVIGKFQEEVARQEGVINERNDTIMRIEKERNERYQQYEESLMIGEKSRMELHNSLIEVKGNIRVYARVRPMLDREIDAKGGSDYTHFEYPEGTDHRGLHVVEVPGHQSTIPGKSEQPKTLQFLFDKVYHPEQTQEQVFNDISQLVQSSLDGYKVCVFAYGQTGSGKTYTMEGPDPGHESEQSGMIARAVNQIFDNCQWKSKQTGFRFKLLCSFLEIYNESIHDLLNPQETYDFNPNNSNTLKHEIRIIDNEAIVTNIREEEVCDPRHVYELLRIANDNRRTAGTKMNERASRSHSVFIMKIKGYNEATRQEISGQLNLIDLAGSERLAKSGAEGNRLRETQHINKSLACLGDVIAALGKGDGAHVPFRQSKLTHLLQPSMTNESKTLMFVNINPVPDHLKESLCSLRFASKVNACEIGIARRRVKSSDK
eukprot:TRINITY_DN537_c0_g1_i2.p1 TRINITY_DN537_c0_g1~~TRINITY_DN537_c0_g1_i2.p1  ORF type:complete len:735 (+),score=162.60 TRINITY_DN537_c0_g1_i2:64-2268(+)